MPVKMNGDDVDRQWDTLNPPVERGTAFFVQDHFSDYSKAKQEMAGSANE
jgi:hypothetical protein